MDGFRTASRLFKKAVQQGRSKRRGEAYSVRYVEPLSAARTPLADFFNSLLVKEALVRRLFTYRFQFFANRGLGSRQTVLLARRTRTIKLCSSDARSEGQSGRLPLEEKQANDSRYILFPLESVRTP